MEKVKVLERCLKCGKPVKLELNFFGDKKDVVKCLCSCEDNVGCCNRSGREKMKDG